MAVYISRQPEKVKKQGGGLGIFGSILSAIGMATGNPVLTMVGAGMATADTIGHGGSPMSAIGNMGQFVGAAKGMQGANRDQAFMETLGKTAPQDYMARVMGQPTEMEQVQSVLGGLVEQYGGAYAPQFPTTGDIVRPPAGPMQEDLQKYMLMSGIKSAMKPGKKTDLPNAEKAKKVQAQIDSLYMDLYKDHGGLEETIPGGMELEGWTPKVVMPKTVPIEDPRMGEIENLKKYKEELLGKARDAGGEQLDLDKAPIEGENLPPIDEETMAGILKEIGCDPEKAQRGEYTAAQIKRYKKMARALAKRRGYSIPEEAEE